MVPNCARMRKLCLKTARLLGLGLVCMSLTAGAQASPPGKSYALLIGAGAYAQWPALVNPVPDVRALASELRRYGFLPEVLENPRREEIRGKLRRYAEMSYGPDDQLVIVFAGHGTYDEVTRIGYLAAQDSASHSRDPHFDSLLDYPELLTLIDNIACRRILLVVDACFSGALADAAAATAGGPRSDQQPAQSRSFLVSAGKDYTSDGDPDQHTPFMRQLLAGLRSPGSDRALTLEELQQNFLSQLEPAPLWGQFGQGGDPAGFTFGIPSAAAARRSPALSAPAVPVSAAPLVHEAPARLRFQPASAVEAELKRTFKRLNLYEAAWHPEGDFPNQYRTQSQGMWDVVVDLEAGLTWQQGGSADRMSRQAADAYVRELNRTRHAGFSDWRLPTLEELASLLEPGRQVNDLYLYSFFDSGQETCWSADSDRSSSLPYFVSFNVGRVMLGYSNRTAFVRAVRNN